MRGDIWLKLRERDPESLAHRRDLSIALTNVGRINVKQEDHGVALNVLTESLEIKEELVARDPANLSDQGGLYIVYYYLGQAARLSGQRDAAIAHLERGLALARSLRDRGWTRGSLPDHIALITEELRVAGEE